MRIVHLSKYLPEFPGGIEQVTKSMAVAGQAFGAQVEIVGVSAPRRELGRPSDALVQRRIECKFHVGPVPIAPEFFLLGKDLAQADLIHVHLPNPLAELAILRFLAGSPRALRPAIVPVIHSPILRWPWLARSWNRWIHEPLLEQCDAFLVSSRQLLATLPYRATALSHDKARVIPFGIEIPSEVVPEKSPGDGKVRLLSVGRLVRYKGFDILMEALAKVTGNWELTLLGQGPESASLRAQIARLGLGGRVVLLEGASEKTKHRKYRECDLFVFPSRTAAEGFGIAIGEAFAHGKPVVTTRLETGVAFLARGGECGAVVAPDSAEELAGALTSLIRDPKRRQNCGEANLEFWGRELKMEVYYRRYADFLSELANRKASSPARRSSAI